MPNETENRFRREPQSLEAWESWVDHLIVSAQEQGAFDNLAGHGKPLKLEDAPFGGGLEVGFGLMKNAGVAPFWIEVEKEMRAASEGMAALLARAVEIARTARRAPAIAPQPETAERGRRRFWSFLLPRSEPEPLASPQEIAETEIDRLRGLYLEQAETLERATRQYNDAIPRDLWWLERPRRSVAEAVAEWDHALAME
jgi:hypothetical protein